MSVRQATHAGSWYTDKGKELNKQLDDWLGAAELSHGPARAIIAPHAGYQYCGACGAYAYRQVSPHVVRRVFILGPSHHVRLAGCALSVNAKYRTPLYDLVIDEQIYAELAATRQFEWMKQQVDEDEHSIEMHLPYIAKVMEDGMTCQNINGDHITVHDVAEMLAHYDDPKNCTDGAVMVTPGRSILARLIKVGSLTPEREADYGRLFARYLSDPRNLFVISSDFCHWGQRFRYTYHDRTWGEIHQSIQRLDRMGMDIIESLNPPSFTEYLKNYGNTICGRHPIGVLLQAVNHLEKGGQKMSLKFLKYAQSSQCRNMSDSSVSYAAASLVFE